MCQCRTNATLKCYQSFLENHRFSAQSYDRINIVTDKKHRSAFARYLSHLTQAFFLKLGIANSEHFVDDKYLRLQVRSDGESKSNIHAARVAFHGRVDVRIDLGKRY